MSGILCCWAANTPQTSEQWYEDEYIPSMTAKVAQHSLHCEVVEVGIDGEVDGVGDRDKEAAWQWLTVYEMENADKATSDTYDTSNHPKMRGALAQARFDVRTYQEIKRWQQDDWKGYHGDVASLAVMEWRIDPGHVEKVLDFYKTEAAPTIASSPDVLRLRIFEVKNATVMTAASYETKKKEGLHSYFTLVELESEEWPWDVIVALGEKPKWREYFEGISGGKGIVKWRSSHYSVKRSYPEDGSDD